MLAIRTTLRNSFPRRSLSVIAYSARTQLKSSAITLFSAQYIFSPILLISQRKFASGPSTEGTTDNKKSKNTKNAASDNRPVPDEFFDENVEKEKEFLDMATSLAIDGGLENLTTSKDSFTWKEIDEAFDNPSISMSQTEDSSVDSDDIDTIAEQFEGTGAYQLMTEATSNEDLAQHLNNMHSKTVIPEEYLNYSMPWRTDEEFPHAMLDKFIPRSSKELYRHDQEGDRSCEGKSQRKGKSGELRCHLIDLDALNHLDVLTLRRFLSDDGEIMGKKQTGLCSKCQRAVAKTIKRSRNFGIAPHLSEYVIQDSKPLQKAANYHEPLVGDAGNTRLNKTILK